MDQDINESRETATEGFGQRFKEATRASQAANDLFDETLTQFLGINRTDGRCIDLIDRRGRVSAGQLANDSGLTTGAVTAVIDRLEAAGYVVRTRDTLDRRKIWIELTDDMKAITRRIFGHYEKTGSMLLARFTPDQLAAIMQFLEIGTFLQTEMAEALREHLDPRATTPAARLIQARAFERAVEANRTRLQAELSGLLERKGW
ncbi:MarR family winged helix-turn-helix transcriptional regulator [Devosia sp. A16]|uniref:MarR family winged helix-turn-helix transcriptional regulator n=1 Tax=Devosia sp. A16 TaxID=1736675 RepID=UPI0006D7D584|nr:MarR family transcriptional regulator [Devosia sp. A16]